MTDRRFGGESLNRKVASVYRRYDSPSEIIAAARSEGMITDDPALAARYIATDELLEEMVQEMTERR